MDKLETTVCADWTILEAAMKKMAEIRDLLDGLRLVALSNGAREYDTSTIRHDYERLSSTIEHVARSLALALDSARVRHYWRSQKKAFEAGTIGFPEYNENLEERLAYRQKCADKICTSSIEDIRSIMIPDMFDLPF